MIIELKKPITRAKIEKAKEKLNGAKSAKKPFKAANYAGKINWGPLNAQDIQKQMRDEWQ